MQYNLYDNPGLQQRSYTLGKYGITLEQPIYTRYNINTLILNRLHPNDVTQPLSWQTVGYQPNNVTGLISYTNTNRFAQDEDLDDVFNFVDAVEHSIDNVRKTLRQGEIQRHHDLLVQRNVQNWYSTDTPQRANYLTELILAHKDRLEYVPAVTQDWTTRLLPDNPLLSRNVTVPRMGHMPPVMTTSSTNSRTDRQGAGPPSLAGGGGDTDVANGGVNNHGRLTVSGLTNILAKLNTNTEIRAQTVKPTAHLIQVQDLAVEAYRDDDEEDNEKEDDEEDGNLPNVTVSAATHCPCCVHKRSQPHVQPPPCSRCQVLDILTKQYMDLYEATVHLLRQLEHKKVSINTARVRGIINDKKFFTLVDKEEYQMQLMTKSTSGYTGEEVTLENVMDTLHDLKQLLNTTEDSSSHHKVTAKCIAEYGKHVLRSLRFWTWVLHDELSYDTHMTKYLIHLKSVNILKRPEHLSLQRALKLFLNVWKPELPVQAQKDLYDMLTTADAERLSYDQLLHTLCILQKRMKDGRF